MPPLGATLGPPSWVDGPYPVIRPYRLLDVATIVDDDPRGRWRNGVQVYSYPPDLAFTWNPCPPGSSQQGATKMEGGVIPLPIFNAYTVYVAESCGGRGIGAIPNQQAAQDAFVARAEAVFAAVESYGVEREFAQGIALPENPYLADGEGDFLNNGDPTSAQAALALLEEAIGETGRGGVIHATPGTVTAWESLGYTLDKVGGKLVTRGCGTPVVVGTGYIGAIPEGYPALEAGTSWAFATGPLTVRRGETRRLPERIQEAFNTETNEVTYRVERDYLADWDTVLQAAVLVDWTA